MNPEPNNVPDVWDEDSLIAECYTTACSSRTLSAIAQVVHNAVKAESPAHRDFPTNGVPEPLRREVFKTFGFKTERRNRGFRIVITILWIKITIDIP